MRDLTASLLTEVCHGVCTGPHLQSLSGEAMPHESANVEDGARLDVVANGFWGGRFEKAFLDVRVFNPSARSNRQTPCKQCTDDMNRRRSASSVLLQE